MAVKHSAPVVGTTRISLVDAVPDQQADKNRSLLVSNEDDAPVFLGGSTVTVTDYGYKLLPGGEISLDLKTSDRLYAISEGSVQLRILHTEV